MIEIAYILTGLFFLVGAVYLLEFEGEPERDRWGRELWDEVTIYESIHFEMENDAENN